METNMTLELNIEHTINYVLIETNWTRLLRT